MPRKAPQRTRAQVEADKRRTLHEMAALVLERARSHPLAKPLTPGQIQKEFPHLSIQAVYWYLAAIHAAGEVVEDADRGMELDAMELAALELDAGDALENL
jgi:hypothetical protein